MTDYFMYGTEKLLDISHNARIRLHSKHLDGAPQLFLITESGEIQITTGPNPHPYGRIYEQGRKIIFTDDEQGNEYPVIKVYDMRNGKIITISSDDMIYRSAPFVTKQGLVYWVESRDGQFKLVLRDLEQEDEVARTVFESKNEFFTTNVTSQNGDLLTFVGDLKAMSRNVDLHVFSVSKGEIIGTLSASKESSEYPLAWYEHGNEFIVLSTQSEYRKILAWNIKTGEQRVLATGTADFILENARMNQADNSLLVIGNTYGRSSVRIIDIETLSVLEETILPGTLHNIFFTEMGWLGNFSSFYQPNTIFYVHPARSFEEVFSSFSSEIDGDIQVDSVWFTSQDGTKIHGFLLSPGNTENNDVKGGIIYVHGGPRTQVKDEWDPNFQYWVNQGYYVLIVNYRGSLGYGRKFEQAVLKNPAVLELQDLQAAKAFLVKEKNMDKGRIIIHGRSYGGYLTLMALTTQLNEWAAGYSLAGIADLKKMYEDASEPLKRWCINMIGDYSKEQDKYIDRSPITHVESLQDPLLIIHGRNDTRCPPSQMKPFIEKARSLKKDVVDYWYDGGHVPTTVSVNERRKWAEIFMQFLSERGL